MKKLSEILRATVEREEHNEWTAGLERAVDIAEDWEATHGEDFFHDGPAPQASAFSNVPTGNPPSTAETVERVDSLRKRRAWEEEWFAEEGDIISTAPADCIFDESSHGKASKHEHEARACLAAAAPDMARALLAILFDVEAALADDRTDQTANQHRAIILTALRKAGVRGPSPQSGDPQK